MRCTLTKSRLAEALFNSNRLVTYDLTNRLTKSRLAETLFFLSDHSADRKLPVCGTQIFLFTGSQIFSAVQTYIFLYISDFC